MRRTATDDDAHRLRRYESLQAALDLIDQGFTLMDRELRLVACNEAFLRLLDFPPALGRTGTPFEAFIRYNAERGDYGPGDPQQQIEERLARARRFEPHEFERTRPDGRVLQVRGTPVPGIGFITLYSDVTEQRRAERQIREHAAELERRVAERTRELQLGEAQMRLITDSIPALIAYFDQRKAYRYINRGYVEWFGLDPQRLEAISAREYLGDTTYEQIRPNVARAFAGEPVSFEYEARCVDGRVRMAHTTLIPEKAADGTVIGCFELTFDVSELRRAQERLAQAQKMEALGQLTGGLAHDFNNMLTVMLGNLGALRERRLGGAAADEFLDPALAAARRGAELIRSLLGFARRQPLQAQAADVGALAGTVAQLLRRSLPEALAIEVEAGGAARAWVDPSRLQDALVNLVLNARDAQAVRVRVQAAEALLGPERAAELQAAPGRYLRVDVRDDGHGMDAATRARVFEPFFTTKRPGAGTGLGLAMVYGFVRQSGGAIELSSRPGQGTTVSLWLPLAEAEPAPARSAEAGGPGRIAEHALALLVEDDAEVRKVVRRSLVDLGFAVVEAENGAEALHILDHTPHIELLLSDVVMPDEIDGRAVARHARALRVPRVALMSGFAPGEAGDDAGVPMLAKPFSVRQLADFLRRAAHG
ncbi:MAG: PAS-domain containing protein [Piscinibacter sp.]|uniref:PAS-domain containing protein n=1 Tax=Piscinibacter sp. TaxID=1903157 RepID=UPI00258BE9A3|nr:PAS-domain containing protein [Piscinibacter sp.]MCW5662360.1 PAS-domain containing protein [Piscinibacter sp.]